ncbi:MAG TPA: hypothetical protein VGF40_00800 [Thermoanaerobaculia bacterium]
MRILVWGFVLSIALASVANAAVLGTGDSIAIAGGAGVDLLVWRDGTTGSIKAMRFGANGAALDASGFDLALPAGGNPSVAWDGSGFLVATTGSNTLLARIPITGGAAFTLSYASSPQILWSAVASKKDGTSLVVWYAGTSTYATAITAHGEATLPRLLEWAWAWERGRLVRDPSSYLVAWMTQCYFPRCPPETEARLIRLDDLGTEIAPLTTFATGIGNLDLVSWSLAEGSRALLTGSSEGTPAVTRLFSIAPGALGARGATIRFPEPLSAQSTPSGQALIGLGARIDLSETGAPLTVNWAPVPDGQRLVGILPSSGARVLAPVSGAGAISVEAPASDVSEVGLAPVFVSPDTVWLKVDNRGPDAARTIDVWLTGAVHSISSLVNGTITRHGALSRIRFNPTLKQGAGFEIAIYFEQPIDAHAFEAWALTLGTDRDATNNYVTTRADEPETPRRRRTVRR